jgi:hypothetical protein
MPVSSSRTVSFRVTHIAAHDSRHGLMLRAQLDALRALILAATGGER